MKKTIKVKAGEGLTIYIASRAAGGRVRVLTGDEVLEVPANMRFIRRRIAVEDLIVVKEKREPKARTQDKPRRQSTSED